MSHFFRRGDIIMTETGTTSTGGREFVLPEGTQQINSSIWLSIGFMLPAAQGACLAQRHRGTPGRTILFEGDGSFQLTAQELSTMIVKKLDITIFLINNNGYTIERLIHGRDAEYNGVAPWRYLEFPSAFGAPTDGSYNVKLSRASTWGELDEVLADPEIQDGPGLRMIEIILDTYDAPEPLKILTSRNVKSYQAKN
jgi:pyruvate decarboxylase